MSELRCARCKGLLDYSLPWFTGEPVFITPCSCKFLLEPPDEPKKHEQHYTDPFFQSLVGHALNGLLAQPSEFPSEIMTLEKWLLHTSSNAIKYAETVYFRIKENERLSKP